MRNTLVSTATWNISDGAHYVESSRIMELSGHRQSSATSLRGYPFGENFNLSTEIGPRIVDRARADEFAQHCLDFDLDAESRRLAYGCRKPSRLDRSELHDRVFALPLDTLRVAATFHPPGSHSTLDADTGRCEHSLSASERVRTLAQRGATA